MSQLTDFIKSYGAQKAADYCRSDPSFAVFNLLWSDPEQLIPVCEKMGWQTLDELVQWVEHVNRAIGNTRAFIALINPSIPIDYSTLEALTFQEIHALIVEQCNIRTDCFFDQSDSKYRLASKTDLEWLAANFPHKTKKWAWDRHDCDDFARSFLGWLASNGLGNLAIGFCAQTHYRNSQLLGGHATLLCVDTTRKVWIIDPQTGIIAAPKSLTAAKMGGFMLADSMQLARVLF